MECTLATLIACFSWSGFYLDTGLSYQKQGLPGSEYEAVYFDDETNGVWREDLRYTRDNPYASVAIGYELNLRNVTLSLSAEHRSSINTGRDRGLDFVTLKARWFPFR